MTVTIDEFTVADSAADWSAAGFSVGADSICRVGTVRLRFVGRSAGSGIVAWSVQEAGPISDIDGVPTYVSTSGASMPGVHPNGVTSIDHAVLMSPDLDRTVAALSVLGVSPRRTRDAELGGTPVRQIFFRFGAVVLEVIGTPDAHEEGPSRFWGLTYTVADIDASAAFFGDSAGRVKDAVQPGRRITTLRHRELGLSVRTALISP